MAILRVILTLLFQFHKGTIRTILVVVLVDEDHDFNSIKVRLELDGISSSVDKKLNFNSIKVRLEPTGPFANEKVTTFQFHKGTIRTNNYLVSDDKLYIFQFHKGTIRTRFNQVAAKHKGISIP